MTPWGILPFSVQYSHLYIQLLPVLSRRRESEREHECAGHSMGDMRFHLPWPSVSQAPRVSISAFQSCIGEQSKHSALHAPVSYELVCCSRRCIMMSLLCTAPPSRHVLALPVRLHPFSLKGSIFMAQCDCCSCWKT